MSYKRQLRRNVKRQLHLQDDEANRLVEEYIDRKTRDQNLYDLAMCQTLLAFAAYQRFHEHRGKRKIAESVAKFSEQIEELRDNNMTLKEMHDKLKGEAGYDFWQQMKELELTDKFVAAFRAIHGTDRASDARNP